MRYRRIGKTTIQVSEIGFGCWTMGGPNWSLQNGQSIGWADVKEDEVLDGIRIAIEGGVNHWDNADIYGNGRAERMLAWAFKELGVRRELHVIATKTGHFRGTAPYGYEPNHIRNQCEQSLRNLGLDEIDIYYFHHGTYTGPGYDGKEHDYLEEAAAVMHDLKKQGKIRAIGQSAYSNEDFARAIPVLKPDVLQNKANLRYDDFIRKGCELQKLMAEHGCTFVGFGPLDQGILLDKFDPKNPPKFEEGDYRQNRKDFNPETLAKVRDKLAQVKERFEKAGRIGPAGASLTTEEEVVARLASVACRWVLSHDRVSSTIPGFRNGHQAACNVRAAFDPPMSEADAQWLRQLFTE